MSASAGDENGLDYRRTFEIGRSVDVERISAELENGVVRVHLPKLDALKPRQIPVEVR